MKPWLTNDYLQPFLPRYPMQDLGNIHRREVHEALGRWTGIHSGKGFLRLNPKGWNRPGKDLHTWNSSSFHSFIVEQQNISWDITMQHISTLEIGFLLLFFVFCSPHVLSWNTTHHMLFFHTITIQPVLSAVAGEAMVGCSYLRSGKRFGWFWTYIPTAKVCWEKTNINNKNTICVGRKFADALGLVSKCPIGMQGQIQRTGKQPWASSKHHRCLSRS